MFIEIDQVEAYLLLVSAVRYALGRQTYIVRSTCESVRKLAKHLDICQLEVILRDVSECRDYGSAADQRKWLSLAEFLRTEIAARTGPSQRA